MEYEFGNSPLPDSFSALWAARQEGAQQAARYHIGRACLRHWIRRAGRAHVYVNDPSNEHHLNTYTAMDITLEEHVSSEHEDPVRKRIGHEELSGIHPECTSGTSCGSCPWLAPDDGLPYFLWDRHESRTVEVSSLNVVPEYFAISHTWGRWRIPGREKFVAGVEGWAVPENTLFDVDGLSEILSSFPIESRFVWFDLICIPQDRSERAATEIARQATIFKNAKHCIVWLNTVDNWQGLRDAVELMAIQSITRNVVRSVHIKDLPTNLFEVYDYAPLIDSAMLKAKGWFTSLWTLQEICLRPDMWLCNSRMELFTVAGETTPVALNTIANLCFDCSQLQTDFARFKSEGSPPMFDSTHDIVSPSSKFGKLISRNSFQRGYLELTELFDRTSMQRIHAMGREHILILGSNRFCLEYRAEAIMSVLGATSWRPSASNHTQPLSDALVLNQYPLPFLREVFATQGASFFSVTSASPAKIADVLGGVHPVSGTLLPFAEVGSATADTKFALDWELPGEEDNKLVRHWKIQQSGAVEIPRASILTSTRDPSPKTLIAMVWHMYDEPLQVSSLAGPASGAYEGRRMCSVDLRDWCRQYFPSTANFAVELRNAPGSSSRGILLKQFSADSKRLFKVGNYLLSPQNRHVPGGLVGAVEHEVEWTVV